MLPLLQLPPFMTRLVGLSDWASEEIMPIARKILERQCPDTSLRCRDNQYSESYFLAFGMISVCKDVYELKPSCEGMVFLRRGK
jgi:hypothetical protein